MESVYKAWKLMIYMKRSHPFLLTHKSISIILAKFQSYEDTLEAFKRMRTEGDERGQIDFPGDLFSVFD
ncbi:hypothetical protein GQ457_16G027300 [Hibiscus cannabinus]